MKIDGVTPTGQINSAKKKKAVSDGDGDFSSFLDSEETTSVTNTAPMTSINPFLSLQEVADQEQPDIAQAKKQGFTVLDYLSELKMGLLSGNVNPSNVSKLKDSIQSGRNNVQDKVLSDILDAIDVRAAVELAKLEKQQS